MSSLLALPVRGYAAEDILFVLSVALLALPLAALLAASILGPLKQRGRPALALQPLALRSFRVVRRR